MSESGTFIFNFIGLNGTYQAIDYAVAIFTLNWERSGGGLWCYFSASHLLLRWGRVRILNFDLIL